MNVWWEIFCRTGNLDAYLESREKNGEESDGAAEGQGDSNSLDTDG